MPKAVKVNKKSQCEIYYDDGKKPKFFAKSGLYINALDIALDLEKKVGKGNVYIVDSDGEIRYGA